MARPRLRPALAFVAGFVLALPLAPRPSFLGPTCDRKGPTGAIVRLSVVSATRDGAAVTPPAGFTPFLENRASADASVLEARLVDAGDGAGGAAVAVTRKLRRLP